MTRQPRIYTRTGDDGSTGLGDGRRVLKSAARVAAYGTVDELNAQLGVVLAASPAAELSEPLKLIQGELFELGAELCVPDSDTSKHRIEQGHVAALEALIDRLGGELPPLKHFVLPGGHLAAAHLHVARAVCRRAERLVVGLAEREAVGPVLSAYLNRLSDALFVLARFQNHAAGVSESLWQARS